MRRDDPGRLAVDVNRSGPVLHVVGRVTESVHSFLGPTTRSLLDVGIPQVVVLLDAPELRTQLARFDARVEVISVPIQRNGWRHWVALARTVRGQLRGRAISAVHFHGLRPWLIAVPMARQRQREVAIYLSPHGSRLLGLLQVVEPFLSLALPASPQGGAYIASSLPDADRLTESGMDPMIVEGAVSDEFFAATRHEARRPLIVTGNHRDVRSDVELASSMAVILGAAELGLAFNWFGPTGAASRARLEASNVAIFGSMPDDELANRLAAGWVFVALGSDAHFPTLLAQAMATGLACVAADTPMHRTMIEHGVTGLLYADEPEMQTQVTRLIDSATLRRQLGDAARGSASLRFSGDRFREKLVPIYRPERR